VKFETVICGPIITSGISAHDLLIRSLIRKCKLAKGTDINNKGFAVVFDSAKDKNVAG
jgi:hypothetical protein